MAEVKDSENNLKPFRFDQNFLVTVQTNSEVPADVISQLVGIFEDAGVPGVLTYVGTIDYGE